MTEQTKIRLKNLRTELMDIYSQHDPHEFIFGFHYHLKDNDGNIVDAFSLSNMPQGVLIDKYMTQIGKTIERIELTQDSDGQLVSGTKVVCINNKHFPKDHNEPIPKLGEPLTIKDCFRSLISNETYLLFDEIETNDPLFGYNANRFISYDCWLGRKSHLQ